MEFPLEMPPFTENKYWIQFNTYYTISIFRRCFVHSMYCFGSVCYVNFKSQTFIWWMYNLQNLTGLLISVGLEVFFLSRYFFLKSGLPPIKSIIIYFSLLLCLFSNQKWFQLAPQVESLKENTFLVFFFVLFLNHSRKKSCFVAFTQPVVLCFTATLSNVKNPPHPPQNI